MPCHIIVAIATAVERTLSPAFLQEEVDSPLVSAFLSLLFFSLAASKHYIWPVIRDRGQEFCSDVGL